MSRDERLTGRRRQQPESRADEGDGEQQSHVPSQPAERARARGEDGETDAEDDEAETSARPADIRRRALDGAPGIPAAGPGTNLEKALRTPDSELGGVIASDTTPSGPTGDEPDADRIRRDDRKRNTL